MGERETLLGNSPQRAATDSRGGTWVLLALLLIVLAAVLWYVVPRWVGQRALSSSTTPPNSTEINAHTPLANNSDEARQTSVQQANPQFDLRQGATVASAPPAVTLQSAPAMSEQPAQPVASGAGQLAEQAPLPVVTPANTVVSAPMIAAASGGAVTSPGANALANSATNLSVSVLAESTYLLRAAQDRVVDAHDLHGAIALLDRAALLLANQPQFDALRSALATDIAALRASEIYDRERLFTRLAKLDERWDAVPLALTVFHAAPLSASPMPSSIGVAAPESTVHRYAQGVASYLQTLVRIRTDRLPEARPLVDMNQTAFVRQALHLTMQRAQIAVLRNQPKIYAAAIATAHQLLAQHGVGSSIEVRGASAELKALAVLDIARPLPRLSALGVLLAPNSAARLASPSNEVSPSIEASPSVEVSPAALTGAPVAASGVLPAAPVPQQTAAPLSAAPVPAPPKQTP